VIRETGNRFDNLSVGGVIRETSNRFDSLLVVDVMTHWYRFNCRSCDGSFLGEVIFGCDSSLVPLVGRHTFPTNESHM
jgi:hypothetical protein